MVLLQIASPPTLQAVVICLTVLSFTAVGLRLYTRQALRQTIKIDDWFALVAYVGCPSGLSLSLSQRG